MIEFDIAIDRWFYLIGYLHMYNRHLNLSLAYIFSHPNIRQRDASDASQHTSPTTNPSSPRYFPPDRLQRQKLE